MFRTLAGLWNFKGKITRPKSIYYIPQSPYMVPGTLKEQVIYPHSPNKVKVENKQLEELLDVVGLKYLYEREGWNVEKNWLDVLSGGEKQRIAMARLFYHKPNFGILDEATSAVSVGSYYFYHLLIIFDIPSKEIETAIYETCKKLGITILSVSHKPELNGLHDIQLELKGEGNWEVKKLN